MNCIKHFVRRGFLACSAFASWLMVVGVAFAAPMAAKEEPKPEVGSGVYVMLYFLVIFGIALGMVSVCRPTNRRDRIKAEQFADRVEAEG